MVHQVTEEAMQETLKTQHKVVVMFYANWCGSCRLFMPKFEKLSNKAEMSGLYFCKINAEYSPVIRKIAGVNALPYFAAFLQGSLYEAVATLKEDSVTQMAKHLIDA